MTGSAQAGGQARAPDRGVARRQAFLQAGRQVFLEQGFEAASVNDVVRLAGGSLATLYAQFGNKEGLFLAVTQEQHERFARAITPDCLDDLTLEEGLQATGEKVVRALLDRDNLAFFRIIVGEGRKFPELMQRFVSTGADKARDVIADFLRKRVPGIETPEIAASSFMEMVRARHHYRALSTENYALSDAELTAHVAAIVRIFLHGVVPAKA
ncbi:MAG: TetR/AcrR family transcriptional regulator [Hyphomonadaceae bacterium]